MTEAGADACETPIRALSRPMSRDDPARIEADADGIAAALARVRARSPIPIIEHVADLGDVFLAAVIRHRAVDIVNVVPCQAGGLRRAQRLIHAAETAGIPALLGSTVELGPGYRGVRASRGGVGKRPHPLGPGRPRAASGGRLHNALFPGPEGNSLRSRVPVSASTWTRRRWSAGRA